MKMQNRIIVAVLLFTTLHTYGHEEIKPISVDISYITRGNSLTSRLFPYTIPIHNSPSYLNFEQKYSGEKPPRERLETVKLHRFYENETIRSSVFSRLIGCLAFVFFTAFIGRQTIWETVQAHEKQSKKIPTTYFSRTGLCAIGFATFVAADCCLDFFPRKDTSVHEKTIAGISLGFSQQGFEAKIAL